MAMIKTMQQLHSGHTLLHQLGLNDGVHTTATAVAR
jgi:hypothetical protein